METGQLGKTPSLTLHIPKGRAGQQDGAGLPKELPGPPAYSPASKEEPPERGQVLAPGHQ